MPAFNPTPAPVGGAGPAVGDPSSDAATAARPTGGAPDRRGHGSPARRPTAARPAGNGRLADAYGTTATATATPSDASVTTPPPPTSTDPPPTACTRPGTRHLARPGRPWRRQRLDARRGGLEPGRQRLRPLASAPMALDGGRAASGSGGGPSTAVFGTTRCAAAPAARRATAPRATQARRAPARRPTAPTGRPTSVSGPATPRRRRRRARGRRPGVGPAAPPSPTPHPSSSTPRRCPTATVPDTPQPRPGRPGQRAAPPRAPVAPLRPAPHPGARGVATRPGPPVHGRRRRGPLPLPGEPAAAQAAVGRRRLPTRPRTTDDPRTEPRMTASLDWLLADFARETPGVSRALVVSADGLRLATSPGMTEALGDQLSAAASGLVSLAKGAARLLDAGPRHARPSWRWRAATCSSPRSTTAPTLAVHADRNCDIGHGRLRDDDARQPRRATRSPRVCARAPDGERGRTVLAGRRQHVRRTRRPRLRRHRRAHPLDRARPADRVDRHRHRPRLATTWSRSTARSSGWPSARSRSSRSARCSACPVGVARVLVGDLAASGHLVVHGPPSTSDGNPDPRDPRPACWRACVHAESGPVPLKILVAGGFGVGKTTLVTALSEIPPLLTDEAMTDRVDRRRRHRAWCPTSAPPPSRWTSAASPSTSR